MMNWTKPYKARWRVMEVDPSTWASVSESRGYTSATITRDGTDEYPLLESATLTTRGEVATGYHRIEAVINDMEVFPISTLYLQGGTGQNVRGSTETNVDGYSVLYPASETNFKAGEYAQAGMDGAQLAASILRRVVKAPIEVIGGFILQEHIVFDIDSPLISGVWKILDKGNMVIYISGDGTVTIKPRDEAPNPLYPAITKANTFDGYSLENEALIYKREFFPGIFPFDALEIGTDGVHRGVSSVMAQKITLGRGVVVEEKVSR